MRRDRHQVGACVYSKKRRAICGAFCMGKYAYETKCFPGWIVLRCDGILHFKPGKAVFLCVDDNKKYLLVILSGESKTYGRNEMKNYSIILQKGN